MTRIWFIKSVCTLFACIVGFGMFANHVSAQGEGIISQDLSDVPEEFQDFFVTAEEIWEARVLGFRDDLPQELLSQLPASITITSSVIPIDGPGGILGGASPENIIEGGGFFINVASNIIIDIDDAGGDPNGLQDTITHEMGHAIGFAFTWDLNGFVEPVDSAGGLTQYTAPFALEAFRVESGDAAAEFIPIEQEGGAGSALVHWETVPPVFDRRPDANEVDILVAFQIGGITSFISETTYASLADTGLVVAGINGEGAGPFVPTNPPVVQGPRFPKINGPTRFPFDPSAPPPVPDGDGGGGGGDGGGAGGGAGRNVFARAVVRREFGSSGSTGTGSANSIKNPDPYGLRNFSWIQ